MTLSLSWKESPMKTSTVFNKLISGILLIWFPFQLSALDAHLSLYTFNSPDGAFTELCLYINAGELERKMVDSINGQSVVEYTLVISDHATELVVYADRFRLSGPVGEEPENFYDIRRIPVENGDYRVDLTLIDALNPENELNRTTDFSVSFQPEVLEFSTIQLLFSASPDDDFQSRFVKNGFRMEIAPLNYFPPGVDRMYFYNEIYGLQTAFPGEEHYALGIELKRRGSNEVMMSTFSRRSVGEVDPVLRSVDISELGSGEYLLTINAVNREQEIIGSTTTLFYRHNPILDEELVEEQLVTFDNSFVQDLDTEELVYSLKAIAPLISPQDVTRLNNILRNKKDNQMRYFLFETWCNVDPYEPQNSYEQFMEVARAVDKMYYSGFGRGFETDRGRIFLRYGRPDDIENVQTETDAPPYEVWTYSRLPGTGQTEVKFVFYNPSLAGNMYELLHTNARGELNNPNWIRDLYQNAPNIHEGPNYHQVDGIQDGFNRRAIDVFTDN